MKRNEIKKTIEQVVSVEYIAEDGQVFYNEEECRKYEQSALFAVSKRLKKLNKKFASIYSLTDSGCEEDELEIFDIQTENDLELLRRYLYLKAASNGARDKDIQECFTSENGSRKDFVFDNVTAGHEVLVFWSYDGDWFWVHGNGSLEGYFGWIRDKYNRIIATEEN